MVADTEAVEEDEAVGISTAVPTESIAKRRASRSQSFKDLQQPTIAVPSLSAIKPLDTPPADEFMLNLASDPYAPAPGTSLPPTPNELSFEEREIGTPGSEAASPGLADQQYFTQLPPVDRGRHAYMFLAAAIVLEASIWGLPFSVGVLHEYWSSELFANSNAESTLTLVSTLPTGLLFLSGTVLGPCFTMFPWYERHIQYAGIFVATLGLLTSAFVTQPWQLLLTFGVLYPFSAGE
jgi:hypothetical protein